MRRCWSQIRNGDGMLNIDETLLALHEQYYADGAVGYEAVEGQWGLSIAKLWGDKSGSYGYYYNDQMAMGLTDPVTDGGRVKAWIYQDQTGYSDLYTWFDMPALETKPDKTVSLTLQASAWSDTGGGHDHRAGVRRRDLRAADRADRYDG